MSVQQQLNGLLSQVMDKLRLLIGYAILEAITDKEKRQRLQVGGPLAGERHGDIEHWQGYGLSSVPPLGSEVLLAAVGGNRDHLAAILAQSPAHRPRGGDVGDVSLYHQEDSPEEAAENASFRLSLVMRDGKRCLVVRADKIDLQGGDSSLVIEEGKIRLKTADFEAEQI